MSELGYVDINRRFRKLADERSRVPRLLATYHASGSSAATWSTLLLPYVGEAAARAIVVVAASNAGKSTEVRQQAIRLRGAGHFAFVVDAASVADKDLGRAFDARDSRDFQTWQSTTRPAVVFVDAVDQLYLRNRNLTELMHELDRAIDFAVRDFQIVLTARTGAWGPHDRRQLEHALRTARSATVSELTFQPVDLEGFRLLAAAASAPEIDDLMRRVEDEEIEQLIDELRPCDVGLLVDYWRINRRLGTWSEILSNFVTTCLEDSDPYRSHARSLTVADGRKGAQRIGAAAAMMRTQHIILPAVASVPGAINARRLFEDWPTPRLSELFETGLFAHRGDDVVQLPPGAVSQFLAACWFRDRFRAGMDPDELLRHFTVQVFGEEKRHVPQSRRALLGWVASEVPDLRPHLAGENALILLYEGDPERLSVADIASALSSAIDFIVLGAELPSPTSGTLRKLARPEVEGPVLSLLQKYRKDWRAQVHLLLYVEAGRYRSAVPGAMRLAQDVRADVSARVLAIRAVGAAGTSADAGVLLRLTKDRNELVRSTVMPIAIREKLSGQQMVELLVSGSGSLFRVLLDRSAEDIAPADLEAALQHLRPVLAAPPSRGMSDGAKMEVIAILMAARLRHASLPAWIGAFLLELEEAIQNTSLFLTDRRRLAQALAGNDEARRALWSAKFAQSGARATVTSLIIHPMLTALGPQDLPWILEQYEALGEAGGAVRWTLLALWRSMDEAARDLVRAAWREAGRATPDWLDGPTNEGSTIAEPDFSAKERLQAAEALEQNQRLLLPRMDTITKGDDEHALLWAWQHLPDHHSRERRIDFGRLNELVGPELVEVFKTGWKAFWQRQEIPVPGSPNSGISSRLLAGLTGLNLAIRDGLDLSSLSESDAELAARYALYELNALPVWFGELLAARPAPVRRVLEAAVRRSWESSTENHGIIALAVLEPLATRALVRSIVVNQLVGSAPSNRATAGQAARLLVTSVEDSALIVATVRRIVIKSGAQDEQTVPWLRVWAHFDPLGAASWLETLRKTQNARFSSLVQGTAALLDEDLELVSDRVAPTPLFSPSGLMKWIRIVHLAVRPEEDVRHKGAHWVGERERAERFRSRCLTVLARDSSLDARRSLERLSADPSMVAYRDVILGLLDQQLTLACEKEAPPWSESSILALEGGDERPPTTAGELASLVRRHLRQIAALIQNADFGYAEIFGPSTREREIQQWVASCLQQKARHLYSVVRENVVADDKEVDISVVADGVERVPVEIKPLGKYSFADLNATMSEQLMGRYMRAPTVTHGVLLVVRKPGRDAWFINGRKRDLSGLLKALRPMALKIGQRSGKTIGIECIDLVRGV